MNLIDPPCPRFSFANTGRGLAFLAALLLASCAGIGERKTGEPPGVAAESAGVRTLANPPLCGGGGQPDCLIVKIIDIGQGSTALGGLTLRQGCQVHIATGDQRDMSVVQTAATCLVVTVAGNC